MVITAAAAATVRMLVAITTAITVVTTMIT